MNGVCNKLNYENCFAVSNTGREGGLAMLWNSETNVQVKSFSKHHIDVEIQMEMVDRFGAQGSMVTQK
ncbi:hypothetical protein AB3S75_000224 [Citrus x aurantiifolia]